MSEVNLKVALELGMNEQEYNHVIEILGRTPTSTELAMYSVEWSEHCGYPRSKSLLKLLPKKSKYPTRAEGEDAGGIEIADGVYCIFKMESHNHPSQVEPRQGAATGIGGILRDIFTMGARPVALLDSLRFGDLNTDKAKQLLHGVVDGIQFYGNCVGVPTVAGEIYFHPSYRDNCLVNVMAVGIGKTGQIATSKGEGPGNPVLVVGNRTGRDGIGGCSILASHEFSEDDQKRPTVQIGDPFTEKCLIEACMEILQGDAVVAIKDMGAAGITCTTSEMAAAGGVGIDFDLAKVPMREEGMEPWEIMMSESQERMLVTIKQGREDEVITLFEKWNLNAAVVGHIIKEEKLIVRFNGDIVAEVPTQSLVAGPHYKMPAVRPEWIGQLQNADINVTEPKDLNKTLISLLSSPNIASKRWVYEQYDHMVQTNTIIAPGAGDAAVLRIKGIHEGIAVTADCNSRYCYLDPFVGAKIAVAEAGRNLACVGADPAAVTDCLNFGKPEKEDRFWQLTQAVLGIVESCEALTVPVVSGNVSLYNEGPEAAVYPTPTIGMIGVLKDVEKHCTIAFKSTGDKIILLGETFNELGGSEYLSVIHDLEAGCPPNIDLKRENNLQQFLVKTISDGLLKSAHDCSEGGIAVTIAESTFTNAIGAEIELDMIEKADITLFSESQSRAIVTASEDNLLILEEIAKKMNTPFKIIGQVGGDLLKIKINNEEVVNSTVKELCHAHLNPIYEAMGESCK